MKKVPVTVAMIAKIMIRMVPEGFRTPESMLLIAVIETAIHDKWKGETLEIKISGAKFLKSKGCRNYCDLISINHTSLLELIDRVKREDR